MNSDVPPPPPPPPPPREVGPPPPPPPEQFFYQPMAGMPKVKRRDSMGGGGSRNVKILGLGAVVVALVVVAVIAASFLGGTTLPTAQPTIPVVANASPTPSAVAGPTPSAVAASPSPSVGPTETPTALPPTPSPTVAITAPPTAQPTAPPTDTPAPTAIPTPHGTAPPTNATCTNPPHKSRYLNMTSSGAQWLLDSHTAWCVKSVVFTMGTGNGQMKLYLVNNAFEVSPYGWLEVIEPDGFGGQPTYTADLNSISLPNGYDNIPPGTTIQFNITCYSGPCSGSVKITYSPVTIP